MSDYIGVDYAELASAYRQLLMRYCDEDKVVEMYEELDMIDMEHLFPSLKGKLRKEKK